MEEKRSFEMLAAIWKAAGLLSPDYRRHIHRFENLESFSKMCRILAHPNHPLNYDKLVL
jgi:hypothetical protein